MSTATTAREYFDQYHGKVLKISRTDGIEYTGVMMGTHGLGLPAASPSAPNISFDKISDLTVYLADRSRGRIQVTLRPMEITSIDVIMDLP